MHKTALKSLSYAALVLLVTLSSCSLFKEVATGDALVNEFIKVNMEYWYYWNDKIPSGADKKTAFFRLF